MVREGRSLRMVCKLEAGGSGDNLLESATGVVTTECTEFGSTSSLFSSWESSCSTSPVLFSLS